MRHRLPSGILLTIVLAGAGALAGQNRIDVVTPAAPELAAYGPHAVGVRHLVVTDPNRPDILNTTAGGPTARYSRPLPLEIWYPAAPGPGQDRGGSYQVITRDPSVRATLTGRAVRDAPPQLKGAPFPLVVISHGYPGNRFLMSHLGENLASKGYVTVSIDHTDSTYDDQQAFASTLYNRPLDQLFVVGEIGRLSQSSGEAGFLRGLVDVNRAGLVGYSMGGYGVVNAVGGGFSAASETMTNAPPNRLLGERGAGNPEYAGTIDPRIKAAIAIGPWGMQAGFWDAAGLQGIRTPLLFVAGSVDEVSGYEKGTRALFHGAVNADRYLLTFLNAGHNAAAPYPAPAEVMGTNGQGPPAFAHYADPVWDTARMNNILQHFATAHLDRHLKGDESRRVYFDVVSRGAEAVYAVDREGAPQPAHTYWKGFKRGMAVGLVLEHLEAGK
jgi:predicted dienelactone hydrolase